MSLHDPYKSDNIFAKILRGNMPCVKIYEDDNILSIMDAFPQSLGHCLVIPKSPSINLLRTKQQDIAALFEAVQDIAIAVEKALQPDGITITQFNGAPAGQTVFHTHVHIIPRYNNSKLKDHSGQIAHTDMLQDLAHKIKTQLA